MFYLTIETENAAFDDDADGRAETAAILRNIARLLETGTTEGKAQDGNGNSVGRFAMVTPEALKDEPGNIGGGTANAYLAPLVADALERARKGHPLNALDLACLEEAEQRIREHIQHDDDDGDYYGPDGAPDADDIDRPEIDPEPREVDAREVFYLSAAFLSDRLDWFGPAGQHLSQEGFYWADDNGRGVGPFPRETDAEADAAIQR